MAAIAGMIVSLFQQFQKARAKARRNKRTEEISEDKEKVSSPEDAEKVERKIGNPTVQRWLRESLYSHEGQYKDYLGHNLDLLSDFTVEDIMSDDALKKWLFDILRFANQDKPA